LFISLSKEPSVESTGSTSVTLEKSELIEAVKTVKTADADSAVMPTSVRIDPAR
jgi:hypothetical protein